jgi:hypothetical protein
MHKSNHGLIFYALVFLALFLVYNITGIIYNQRRHRMYGTNAIPHIDKWRRLPEELQIWSHMALDKVMLGMALARGYAKRKMEGYK